MPRSYYHIKEYEEIILRLKDEGFTLKEIGEKLGFTQKQIHNFITRYNERQRRIAAGIPIKKKLFDEALKKYNAKQRRSDRMIENYYEKIRTGKQEKPFYEIIVQIGNKDDMGSESEHGELAKTILDEYFQSFEARNPNLYVFSAHLHMDEATPHLHIDFIPFTTGSKRGLETSVSMK